MNWQEVARKQGQTAFEGETDAHFEARVKKLHAARKKNRYIGEWTQNNPKPRAVTLDPHRVRVVPRKL